VTLFPPPAACRHRGPGEPARGRSGTGWRSAPEPDAALIALCRRCLEQTDYVNTAALAENWSDEKVNAACDEIHAMEAQITAAVLVSVAAWSPRPGSFGAP
jgi:hypothetical protein